MTRLGKLILGLIVLLTIGFASMVRFVDTPGDETAQPAVRPPAAGDLVVPVAGVPPGALVDSFDDERAGGERMHGALDIPAPRGTAVIAASAGRVEKLFESAEGGHTVYVRTADGRQVHYYAHLDSYAAGLGEGEAVRAGQPIGTVGFSGNADPAAPHLHFEIKTMNRGERWYQGRAINPYPILAGR